MNSRPAWAYRAAAASPSSLAPNLRFLVRTSARANQSLISSTAWSHRAAARSATPASIHSSPAATARCRSVCCVTTPASCAPACSKLLTITYPSAEPRVTVLPLDGMNARAARPQDVVPIDLGSGGNRPDVASGCFAVAATCGTKRPWVQIPTPKTAGQRLRVELLTCCWFRDLPEESAESQQTHRQPPSRCINVARVTAVEDFPDPVVVAGLTSVQVQRGGRPLVTGHLLHHVDRHAELA